MYACIYIYKVNYHIISHGKLFQACLVAWRAICLEADFLSWPVKPLLRFLSSSSLVSIRSSISSARITTPIFVSILPHSLSPSSSSIQLYVKQIANRYITIFELYRAVQHRRILILVDIELEKLAVRSGITNSSRLAIKRGDYESLYVFLVSVQEPTDFFDVIVIGQVDVFLTVFAFHTRAYIDRTFNLQTGWVAVEGLQSGNVCIRVPKLYPADLWIFDVFQQVLIGKFLIFRRGFASLVLSNRSSDFSYTCGSYKIRFRSLEKEIGLLFVS